MQPLQLLITLRAVGNSTLSACNIGEYNPDWIYRIHNTKLININNQIRNDSHLNQKVKLKFYNEIRKLTLAPCKKKEYHSIQNEVKAKINMLSSAIDFTKR